MPGQPPEEGAVPEPRHRSRLPRYLSFAIILASVASVAGVATFVLLFPRQAAPVTAPAPKQASTHGASSTPVNAHNNPFGLPALGSGKPAPAFSLPRLGGGAPVSLASFRGRPVIVNFFASWCTNCRAELAAYGKAYQRWGSRIAFVGIDTHDGNGAKAVPLLSAAGDRYPVGVDPNMTVAASYLVEALPTSIFVNAQGQVVGESFGAQTTSSLNAAATRLLQPSAGSSPAGGTSA